MNNLNVIKPFDLSSNTVSASDPNYYSSSSFLPLSETIKTPLGVLTKDNFIGNDINTFDNLNSLNDMTQNNGFENIDGNEMINQFDQIVKLNENNFSETVNNVISVSALELNEKLASFFHLLISTLIQSFSTYHCTTAQHCTLRYSTLQYSTVH